MIHKPNLFAVTGGPGAGKTALLSRLAALGCAVVEESARAVLRDEAAAGRGRPDTRRYATLMLARDVAAFHAAGARQTFLDRSLVDAWATFHVGGLEPSPAASAAVGSLRYNPRAFIAPPWRAIYVTDTERIQTWAEAVASYEACAQAYEAAGYDLVEIPRSEVAARAAFVLEAAGA